METIVIVLMILVCFNYMLKQTFQNGYVVGGVSVVCALFTGLMWPYAIEQSKTQLADWLADPVLMLNVAVVLSIEVIIQMAYCMGTVHLHNGGKIAGSKRMFYEALHLFPGMLILPLLFSVLTSVIFALPGYSFPFVAWTTALCVGVGLPLGVKLAAYLLPEKEVRLELLFLTNAFVAILGVVATVNGRTAVKVETNVEWAPLFGLLLLMGLGAPIGYYTRRLLLNYKIKKNK